MSTHKPFFIDYDQNIFKNYENFLLSMGGKERIAYYKYAFKFILYLNNKFKLNSNIDRIYFNGYLIEILRKEESLISLVEEYFKTYINDSNLFEIKEKNKHKIAIRHFSLLLKDNSIINQEIYKKLLDITKLEATSEKKAKKECYLSFKQIKYLATKATLYTCFESPFKLKALIYLLYYTGADSKKINGSKRNDFDFTNNQWRVGENRYLYFPPKVGELILKYFLSVKEENNSFNMNKGRWNQFSRILRKFSLNKRKLSVNYIRNSHINMMIKETKDLYFVSKLLSMNTEQLSQYYKLKEPEYAKIYFQKIKIKENVNL